MKTIRKTPNATLRTVRPAKVKNPKWILQLYVAGQTPKSVTAYTNLKLICEELLMGMYSIEVIDIVKNPRSAREAQILAIPTLVRELPQPVRNIIGDLSNRERVLIGLDLIAQSA